MEEIFENVSNKTKEIADIIWHLAISQKNPIDAANFLNDVTNYYDQLLSEEEVNFLRFYFNMKMEMMKE